ncbi:unnamed protein product [Scytosiphon promiscuus]
MAPPGTKTTATSLASVDAVSSPKECESSSSGISAPVPESGPASSGSAAQVSGVVEPKVEPTTTPAAPELSLESPAAPAPGMPSTSAGAASTPAVGQIPSPAAQEPPSATPASTETNAAAAAQSGDPLAPTAGGTSRTGSSSPPLDAAAILGAQPATLGSAAIDLPTAKKSVQASAAPELVGWASAAATAAVAADLPLATKEAPAPQIASVPPSTKAKFLPSSTASVTDTASPSALATPAEAPDKASRKVPPAAEPAKKRVKTALTKAVKQTAAGAITTGAFGSGAHGSGASGTSAAAAGVPATNARGAGAGSKKNKRRDFYAPVSPRLFKPRRGQSESPGPAHSVEEYLANTQKGIEAVASIKEGTVFWIKFSDTKEAWLECAVVKKVHAKSSIPYEVEWRPYDSSGCDLALNPKKRIALTPRLFVECPEDCEPAGEDDPPAGAAKRGEFVEARKKFKLTVPPIGSWSIVKPDQPWGQLGPFAFEKSALSEGGLLESKPLLM